jgi:hypothetical protein
MPIYILSLINCRINNQKQFQKSLMFCWPCITGYQYSDTNVMHFLFSLLRIKGLYTFRALLAHPQESSTNGT